MSSVHSCTSNCTKYDQTFSHLSCERAPLEIYKKCNFYTVLMTNNVLSYPINKEQTIEENINVVKHC